VLGVAAQRQDARFTVLDLAEINLPLFDEPLPPMAASYCNPHTVEWARTIDSFDAFVFVVPEYNHGPPAALKNAVDYLFAEWNDKAAGFVSYGVEGGIRAIEQMRLVMAELKVATVRAHVGLSKIDDFDELVTFSPRDQQQRNVSAMLDELADWGGVLRGLRESRIADPVTP
jgi:NAD(P)H-dependent FMN reductase